MTPHALQDTAAVTFPRTAGPRDRRPGWLSGGWTTAAMIALVIALAGGGFVFQIAQQGGDDGSSERVGLMSPGTATPETGVLSCGSPGYVPIVEGEMNEDTLRSIGIDETPLHVDGDTLHIPTSSGEVVDLPSTWTPLFGGPLWADSGVPVVGTSPPRGETTVRNIETGQEWTFPAQFLGFPGVYQEPYLIVPKYAAANDWRIINTVTGEERLISDIRGDDFPVRVEIGQVGGRELWTRETPDTTVWVFNTWPPESTVSGPNVLILPQSLDKARFLDEPSAGWFAQDSAYSTSTGRIAYAANGDSGRKIVVVEPGSGEVMVIENQRFGDDTLPLMFSGDGQTLIVDQSDALFSIALAGEPAVSVLHDGDRLVPVTYNMEAMVVLVMFEDRHLALLDARSGRVTDLPDVIVPETDDFGGDQMFRLPYETDVYEIFDERNGTVRLINLANGMVSDEIRVFVPNAARIVPPIQPGFQMEIRYPSAEWTGAYGYLDDTHAFHALSTRTGEEMWSIPAPDSFSVGHDQVVSLSTSPGKRCFVLNVIDSVDVDDYSGERPTGRVSTWVAPLEPGAIWTKLDIAITGWWEMPDSSDGTILPAPEPMTPVATPER